jgi:hypothetical protein
MQRVTGIGGIFFKSDTPKTAGELVSYELDGPW